MNCPIDGTTLLMSERNGIEIDYCPQCRGIWLDRGELDKILERAQAVSEDYAAPAPPAAPQAAPIPQQSPRYDADRRGYDARDQRAGDYGQRDDRGYDQRGYDDRKYGRKKRESPFEFLGDLFG